MTPPFTPPPILSPPGVLPKAPPSIRDNITRLLKANGITGVEFTDELHPDRVFAFDVERSALVHCIRYRGVSWHEDARGLELRKFHGPSAIGSFRELASPSMQIVMHAISDLSPNRRDVYFLELDVDHEAPVTPVKLLVHGSEVLVNAVTRSTTDQIDIARRLDARLGPVQA